MRILSLCLGLFVALPIAAAAPTRSPIARSLKVVDEAGVTHIIQNDKLTMHTEIRRGQRPRVLFATPAANSGVGVFFKAVEAEGLKAESDATPIEDHGVAGVSLAMSGPARLEVDRIMLDSVRALRDKSHGAEAARDQIVKDALALFESDAGKAAGATPELVERLRDWVTPKQVVDPARPDAIVFERRALASGARYRVELIPEHGTTIAREDGTLVVKGATQTRFSVRSFIDRPPEQPLENVLVEPRNAQQENNLGLLVYKTKILAGSYQYLTPFGRDAMISAALLGDKMTPEVHGIAVASQLDRVSKTGRISHEDSNGDQATLESLVKLMKDVKRGKGKLTPARVATLEDELHDYKMVDGEFLLAPLLASYATRVSPATMHEMLTPARLDALARVVARMLDSTATFTGDTREGLVRLRRGQIVGNWRDSGTGLGGGRTPLDVNAYLVPATLASLQKLLETPGFPKEALLERLPMREALSAEALGVRQQTWRKAAAKFEVSLNAKEARRRVGKYLARYAPDERAFLGSQKLWSGATIAEALRGAAASELDEVKFPGLALDARGKPVPVLSGDQSFELFYDTPTREGVMASVTRMFQPYPVGLYTDVGLVVANAAYSNRKGDAKTFDRDAYHGADVWSWPMTMMRKGLEKQLVRYAGDHDVEAVVKKALDALDRIDHNIGAMKSTEMWTWKIENGRYVAVPFGSSAKHATEAVKNQLWSNAE